ncbi:MAG: hypothetical protein ABW328_18275 [Ilumatobacteraceae bacterium]
MTAPGSTTRDQDPTSITGVVDLVKTYAKQETLGPLKGAGKWLALGTAGAALLGVGLALVLLGLLRLIQAEWPRAASGSLSWLPYVIVLVVCVLFALLAFSRINRDSLYKETK